MAITPKRKPASKAITPAPAKKLLKRPSKPLEPQHPERLPKPLKLKRINKIRETRAAAKAKAALDALKAKYPPPPGPPVHVEIKGGMGLRRKDGTYRMPYAKRPKHTALKRIQINGVSDDVSKALLRDTVVIVKDGKLDGFRTKTGDGFYVTWDRCAGCIGHIRNCTCRWYVMPTSVSFVPNTGGAHTFSHQS